MLESSELLFYSGRVERTTSCQVSRAFAALMYLRTLFNGRVSAHKCSVLSPDVKPEPLMLRAPKVLAHSCEEGSHEETNMVRRSVRLHGEMVREECEATREKEGAPSYGRRRATSPPRRPAPGMRALHGTFCAETGRCLSLASCTPKRQDLALRARDQPMDPGSQTDDGGGGLGALVMGD